MGRAFEFRKARKFKRWGNMARVFTKLGKEITIAKNKVDRNPKTIRVYVYWERRLLKKREHAER